MDRIKHLASKLNALTGQIRINDPQHTLWVISDIHDDTITQARKSAVAADAPISPAAMVVAGDLTDYAEAAEDTAVLDFLNGLATGLSVDWYAVCGNHDVWGDARTPAEWATAYGMDGRDFYKDIGSPAFCRLIFLGVNNDDSPHTLNATALSNLDAWLASTSLPTLVVTHFPMFNTATHIDLTHYYSSVQSNWYLKDQRAIWQILKAYNHAVGWISGHIHADLSATGLVKTEQIGSHLVHFIQASSIFYTNKVAGEAASKIVTAFVTVSPTGLAVYYRDHALKKFVRKLACAIQAGLSPLSPVVQDGFSSSNELDVGSNYSTHPCDEEGGLLLLDTNGVMSISGGQLVVNGTPANNDGFRVQRPVMRAAGIAMRLDMPVRTAVPATNLAWGFASTGIGSKVFELGTGVDNNGTIYVRENDGTSLTSDFTATAFCLATGTLQTLLIMRSKGGLILARDDSMSANTWRIIYIFSTVNDDLYAKLSLAGAASGMSFDNLWVGDLGGDWNSDYGNAHVYDAAPEVGDTYHAANGNFIVELTWTATVSPVDVMFRRVDDIHTWLVRLDPGGSTFKLISVNGSETERASVAFSWVEGVDYTIQILCHSIDTSHGIRAMVNDLAASMLAATTNFNPTATGVKVPGGKNLAIWSKEIEVIL